MSRCDESYTWPADFKVLLNYILNNEQVDPGGYYLHSLHNKSLNWAGSLFRSFVFKVKECRHSSSSHFNLGLLLIIINLVLHLYHPNPRVSLLRKFLGKCACIIKIPRSYTKKYVHWKRKKSDHLMQTLCTSYPFYFENRYNIKTFVLECIRRE